MVEAAISITVESTLCESKVSGQGFAVQMNEGPHPVFRFRCIAVAGQVFGEKDITRAERLAAETADTDFDRTRQGNDPLAARSSMPIEKLRPAFYSDHCRVEKQPINRLIRNVDYGDTRY